MISRRAVLGVLLATLFPAEAVEAVIVSADTDNTGESAESYFGDVAFRSRPTS